jgi:hypothetical protein
MRSSVLFVSLLTICAAAAFGASYTSYSSLGGTLITDFNDLTEGTLVDTQYAGVTFSQEGGGRPQIDEFPWLFGYGSVSGHVLTGSLEGGHPFPTVAGIRATFASPVMAVELFLSDTAALGDYPVSIYDTGGALLETITVLGSNILPPGYTGGTLPLPGTFPFPGIFVGFTRGSADIGAISVGPSSSFGDAFSIDDLRATTDAAIPEPGTWVLMSAGLAALVVIRRRALR